MSNQPQYPYRDTTDANGQPPSQQQPSPYPQPQYSNGQYQQAQHPQPSQPNSAQAYPTSGYPGMGYGTPMAPNNTLATIALVLGIIGTLFSLLGYITPGMATLIIDLCLAGPAIALGLAGIGKSKRMNGLRFGHALTGIVLGAFSVILFVVLATSRTGSLSGVVEGLDEDGYVYVLDDDDQQDPAPVPVQMLANVDQEYYDLFDKAYSEMYSHGVPKFDEQQIINKVVLDNDNVILAVLGTGTLPLSGEEIPSFAFVVQWKKPCDISTKISNEESAGVLLAEEEPTVLTDGGADLIEVVTWCDEENLIPSYQGGSCAITLTDNDTGELIGEALLSF